jgi:hypothetical protein
LTLGAADQPDPIGVENSFGIDLVEISIDVSVQGEPITIEIDRGPRSKAIFEAEIVQLMDRGDGLRPKPVLGAGASPGWLSRTTPEGPLAVTIEAAGAPFNKLGLIITRVDAGEKLDPVGAYTITIRP